MTELSRDAAWDFGPFTPSLSATATEWVIEVLPGAKSTYEAWEKRAIHGWVKPDTRASVLIASNASRFWRLPSTHRLKYIGTSRDERLGNALARFIVLFLGVLHGARLEFSNWYIEEERIALPWPFVLLNESGVLAKLLDNLTVKFDDFSESERDSVSSALLLHLRAPSYFNNWESFSWQYTVFDTFWRLSEKQITAAQTHRVSKWLRMICRRQPRHIPHAKRFKIFGEYYQMAVDKKKFDEWGKLRNSLIHQAVWSGKNIQEVEQQVAVTASEQLRNYCTLAILAALDIPTPCVNLRWDLLGHPSHVLTLR